MKNTSKSKKIAKNVASTATKKKVGITKEKLEAPKKSSTVKKSTILKESQVEKESLVKKSFDVKERFDLLKDSVVGSSFCKVEQINRLVIVGNDKIVIKDLVIKDFEQYKNTICELEQVFKELSVLSNKGYINDPSFNLPISLRIYEDLVKMKIKNDLKYDDSIGLNVLCYNMVLLIIHRLIIMLEQ